MRTRTRRPRLRLNTLEDRLAPATFTVLNLFNSGIGSLRAAVINANGNPGPDTVVFDPGVVGTITLTTGEIVINDAVDIQGPGWLSVGVSGNNASRVFNISSTPAFEDVTISGLTLRNGQTSNAGGALAATEQDLRLEDCLLTSNVAGSGGGAVYIFSPTLAGSFTAVDCRFSDNEGDPGGAVRAQVPTTLTRCSFVGNTASNFAGALYSTSGLKIFDCLFQDNVSSVGGAIGIFGANWASPRVIRNSTLSGNSAAAVCGGAIYFAPTAPSHQLQLQNCTVSRNFADTGGGIFIEGNAGSVSLDSTIVSANFSNTVHRDLLCSMPEVVNADYSIIGVTGASFTTISGTGNQKGTSSSPLLPGLAELGDFGGPTLTHALLPGSPALDKGSNPASLSIDQRGEPRVFNGKADVGAYEVNPTTFLVSETVDEEDGDYSASDLSLREAVVLANTSFAGLDTINFNGIIFLIPTTINLTLGDINITAPVTVNGPAARLTLDANGGSRIFDTTSAVGGSVITLNDLTIRDGKMGGGADGGGMLVGDQNVVLNRCVLTNNTVTGGDGGGIAVINGGNLIATECSFSNNSAGSLGGAVFATGDGFVTLSRCTLSNNTALFGGGVYSNANVNILSSALFGNDATLAHGGGLRFDPFGAAATAVVRSSTFSGNSAKGDGGGIFLSGLTATAFVQNCTITANSATGQGGGLGRGTGGVGELKLDSNIIAQNASAGGTPDVNAAVGTVVTAGSNIIGVGDKGDVAWNPAINQLGTLAAPLDARLASLAFNGGVTNTHRLLPLSPAFDKGSNPTGAAFDQRGSGFPRTNGPGTDVGAFEAPALIIVTNDNDSGVGSLRQAVLDANADADRDLVVFDPAFFAVPRQIKLQTALPGLADSVEFIGTSAANVIVTRNAGAPQFGLFNCGISGQGSVSLTNMTITGGAVALVGSGGINAGDDNVTVTSCVISNNTTGGNGGAISVGNLGGTITLVNTTVSGNTANRGAGCYFFNTGTLVVENCTFTGNTATGSLGGGAILVGSGSATIRNSTLSGNTATGDRGGAVTLRYGGSVLMQNCTITGNSAKTTGGGIHRKAGTVTLVSTVVAKNTALTSGNDIQDAVTANFCLIGISDDGPVITGANNKTGTKSSPLDPLLGPLATNGGLTQTHTLLPGSPCLEAGSNPAALTTDQRGSAFPRTVGAGTDIGAFEDELGLVVINAKDAGPGSLRQAVLNANANPGPDVITFDPTYFATSRLITLVSGQISVSDAVTITGPGPSKATVSGNNANRVFLIDTPGTGAAISISGLSIHNGKTIGSGGGVLNQDEALTLTDCVILNSTAQTGGGIASAGPLTLQGCSIANNTATSSGGGLVVSINATAVVRDTRVSGNTAPEGGGILFVANGSSGSLLIESSTVSGNTLTGPGSGGGIRFTYGYGFSGAGSLTLRNATVSGNKGGFGGGVHTDSGTLLVQNCTITANTATSLGGGIYRGGLVSVATVVSTIVSGNANAAAPDISSATKVNVTYSAIGDSKGFPLSGGANLPFGAVLNLGPLASNGGPTQTHALQPGSPCVSKGWNPAALAFDQRGPGFARNVNGAVDIGAFEDQTPAVPAKVISAGINGSPVQRSRVMAVSVVFDRVVNLPTPANLAFELRRQSDNALVALSPIIGPDFVTFTFNGALSEFGSLADGRYTLTVFASQISGGAFDGNGDGVPGDDYVLASSGTAGIFRLFGDSDGDADVDATDYGPFRGAFGGVHATFDFDGDGDVDAADYGQFRQRFGVAI